MIYQNHQSLRNGIFIIPGKMQHIRNTCVPHQRCLSLNVITIILHIEMICHKSTEEYGSTLQ